MPTPRIPTGLKPALQSYSIGAPDGVSMSDVAGGLPRVAMLWDRGKQPFQVTLVLKAEEFAVWSVFFHRVIGKGSIQFTMPLNSGLGLTDHLCMMVPGSYSAAPAGTSAVWTVSFTVLAESEVYSLGTADAQLVLDLWDLYGDGVGLLLARIARFSNFDTLVL